MPDTKECLELYQNRKQKRAPNMACIHKAISGSSEANLGPRLALGWAALLGVGHFVIELGCSCSLNEILDRSEFDGSGIQLFNILAFLSQPIIGLAVDRWNTAKPIAILGGILVIAGICGPMATPGLRIGLFGAGNACFHVGAGALCVWLSRGSVSSLGVFVGPGALGLIAGVGLGRMGLSYERIGECMLIITILAPLVFVRNPFRLQNTFQVTANNPWRWRFGVWLLLITSCIAIRSFVGTGFQFSWNSSASTALLIGIAVAGGKIIGGFFADRFGWCAASTGALVLATPLLWLGNLTASAGLLGVACFQAPMAVTLGALVRLFPSRPGFSFGLASAVVYGGALAAMSAFPQWLYSWWALAALSISALVLLVLALRGLCGVQRDRL